MKSLNGRWAHQSLLAYRYGNWVLVRSTVLNGGIRIYYEFQFQFEFRRTKGDPNVKRTEASISSFPVLGTNVILLSEQNLRSTSFSLQQLRERSPSFNFQQLREWATSFAPHTTKQNLKHSVITSVAVKEASPPKAQQQ